MPAIDWNEAIAFEDVAVAAIKEFLSSNLVVRLWLPTHSIRDVRRDPRFQKRGIDLLWNYSVGGKRAAISVEVKADRQARTGNVFLETISDVDRNVPGCFLTSEATWYFYYFAETGRLLCMPVHIVRPWFEANLESFGERLVRSRRGRRTWKTKGRLVPISVLVSRFLSIWEFRRRGGVWRLVRSGAKP